MASLELFVAEHKEPQSACLQFAEERWVGREFPRFRLPEVAVAHSH